jgi:cystathionine beta-synthase
LHDNNLLESEKFGDLRDLISRRADQGEMITVAPSDSLLVAYNRMRASDISQLPVIKEGDLLGIIDEEDVLISVSKNQGTFSDEVERHMIQQLDVLQYNASEDELIGILSEGKVAIIYNEDTFIGFITKVDLINHYRNRLN